MNEKYEAAKFRKKYALKQINSSTLSRTLENQGYTIVLFNGITDDKNVEALINGLHLNKYIEECKCFTYSDSSYRIVFIHEDLNEEEKTIVLAHEEGHIWNGHLQKNSIFGEDVVQEKEANDFAHYLLNDKNGNKKRVLIVFLIGALLSITVGYLVVSHSVWHNKAVYVDGLYRTESGTKYHRENCIYIQNKTNVIKLTKEEFDSGDYEPCKVCQPDVGNE